MRQRAFRWVAARVATPLACSGALFGARSLRARAGPSDRPCRFGCRIPLSACNPKPLVPPGARAYRARDVSSSLASRTRPRSREGGHSRERYSRVLHADPLEGKAGHGSKRSGAFTLTTGRCGPPAPMGTRPPPQGRPPRSTAGDCSHRAFSWQQSPQGGVFRNSHREPQRQHMF